MISNESSRRSKITSDQNLQQTIKSAALGKQEFEKRILPLLIFFGILGLLIQNQESYL